MSLSIREATKEDAILIADLSRQTFYDTFHMSNSKEDMDKFLGEQFTRGRLILEVGKPQHYFFLAYHQNEVAGYLKLKEGPPPASLGTTSALEIARLYVVQEKIGTGVGALLMQKSIEVAVQKEKEAVWLGVWEDNPRAINFYIKWGFQKFDETHFLLGNDMQCDWLMKKLLS